MIGGMRAFAFLIPVLCACSPSATVQNTMPIANLQSYRAISLRVRSQQFATQGLAITMETAVVNHIRQKCGFESVGPAGSPSDIVLDLTITKYAKGGDSWIRNENQVVMDTLMVLSDPTDGELLGTANIHGKSSGAVVNNAPQENEAIAVIAKTVADVMWKSGCAGPRVAKAPTPPPNNTGSGGTGGGSGSDAGSGAGSGSAVASNPGPDESKRAEAEKLNEQGKERLFNADTAGALGLFQQANAMLPDPKYQFNVCLAFGAMEKWNEAISACQQAKQMNPNAKLAAKIDQRLQGLQAKQ